MVSPQLGTAPQRRYMRETASWKSKVLAEDNLTGVGAKLSRGKLDENGKGHRTKCLDACQAIGPGKTKNKPKKTLPRSTKLAAASNSPSLISRDGIAPRECHNVHGKRKKVKPVRKAHVERNLALIDEAIIGVERELDSLEAIRNSRTLSVEADKVESPTRAVSNAEFIARQRRRLSTCSSTIVLDTKCLEEQKEAFDLKPQEGKRDDGRGEPLTESAGCASTVEHTHQNQAQKHSGDHKSSFCLASDTFTPLNIDRVRPLAASGSPGDDLPLQTVQFRSFPQPERPQSPEKLAFKPHSTAREQMCTNLAPKQHSNETDTPQSGVLAVNLSLETMNFNEKSPEHQQNCELSPLKSSIPPFTPLLCTDNENEKPDTNTIPQAPQVPGQLMPDSMRECYSYLSKLPSDQIGLDAPPLQTPEWFCQATPTSRL